MSANSIRGETSLNIDGVSHRLCLTLGALAEIETGLGLVAGSNLSSRLSKISAKDVLILLQALLAGGGNPVPLESLQASSLEPAEVANAISAAFSLTNDQP